MALCRSFVNVVDCMCWGSLAGQLEMEWAWAIGRPGDTLHWGCPGRLELEWAWALGRPGASFTRANLVGWLGL